MGIKLQFYVLFCRENDLRSLFVTKKRNTHFFCQENDLRSSSGEFLCVEFCHPESSDFLGLCVCHCDIHAHNIHQLWRPPWYDDIHHDDVHHGGANHVDVDHGDVHHGDIDQGDIDMVMSTIVTSTKGMSTMLTLAMVTLIMLTLAMVTLTRVTWIMLR